MMFKRKKEPALPSPEALVLQYHEAQEKKVALLNEASGIRREALAAGGAADDEALKRIQREVEMAEEGMALAREQLSELVAAQRAKRFREHASLRGELESEMAAEVARAGSMLGEALSILRCLGVPFPSGLSQQLQAAIEAAAQYRQGMADPLRDAFLDAVSAVQAANQPTRNFREELAEIALPVNFSEPGSEGFQRAVAVTVEKLLHGEKPAPPPRPFGNRLYMQGL